MSESEIAFRVVCPDGLVADQFDGRDAEVYARQCATNCDRLHDGARCVGPHRIVRAVWAEVAR